MTNVTFWLSIWAAAGPLLAAGVSAWWSNKNRIADRSWAAAKDEIEHNRILLDAAKKDVKDNRRNAINWRRGTFIDFFVSSHDFCWTVQSEKSQEIRETHRQKFTKAFGVLMLLDSVDIGDEAQAVWNACHTVVAAYPHATADQFRDLQVARSSFAIKAQAIIADHFYQFTADLEAEAHG